MLLVGLSACSELDDCAPNGVEDPFIDGPAEDSEGRFWVFPFAIGVLRLVDRLRISLPLTTRLSFDFRRSLVSISEIVSMKMDVDVC